MAGDLGPRVDLDLATDDQTGVEACAAHVGRDDVLERPCVA